MRAFTLIELVLVIVIIGILTTLAISHYGAYREQALDREVKANLDLIIAAERAYFMEHNTYYTSTNEADLNSNLKLFLPTTNTSWDYGTYAGGGNVCADGVRGARTWRLCSNGAEPKSGSCGINAFNCP